MLRKEEQFILEWKTAFLILTRRGQASEIFCEENECLGKLERNLITVVQKAPFRVDENINESFRKKCVLISVVLLLFSWKNKD